MTSQPFVDNMDVFAEKFEGIDLHGKKITKAEFDDCTFVSCKFTEAKNTMIDSRSNDI